MFAEKIIQFPEIRAITPQFDLQTVINEAVSQAVSQIENNKSQKNKLSAEQRAEKLNPIKSNGIKKATAAQPLQSYEEIKIIRDYFKSHNKLREYAIFSIGITLGVRASDLLLLKNKDFFNADGSFLERLNIIEMKTDKLNKPLLTEYAKNALKKYTESKSKINLDDYVFISREKFDNGLHKPVSLSRFNSELRKASKDLGIHLSSHIMRHTFALHMTLTQCQNITLDYNSLLMTQIAMNHANISQTLAYTGLSQKILDEKRTIYSNELEEKT